MIYNVKLHILTPVHIGCDEGYSPLEFVIDSDRNILIHFNLWNFIESLNEKEWQELNKISENSSPQALVLLYRFYSNLKTKIKGREIPVPSELANRYREVKQLKDEQKILKEFNQFEIPRTFFNPYSQTPIIPGSSLKGSLRTGYLEGLFKNHPDKENIKKKPEELEERLLGGKFAHDPFRLLKVSDFEPAGEVKTEIIYQINVSKLRNRSRESLSLPLEVIPAGAEFKGTIKVDKPVESSGIKNPIDFNDLLLKAHAHYAGVFNKEVDIRKNKGFIMPNVSRFSGEIKKKYFLLRIGKHSGAEAVTVDEIRQIRIRTAEGSKIADTSTTIWLASKDKKNLSQAMPFGWVMLEVL